MQLIRKGSGVLNPLSNTSVVIRLYGAVRAWCRLHRDLVFSFGAVILLRVWLAVLGAAVILARGSPIIPNPPTMYHGVTRVADEGLGLLIAPWQRWDAIWYLRIAASGYAPNDASPSFFPLFPILVRLVAWPIENNYLAAALLVSTLATFGAFVLIYRLTSTLIDEGAARRAVVYWAAFPTSFFLLSAYAEPVFAACALAAMYFSRQRRWWTAGVAGAAATLARPVGLLVAVPLAIDAWQAGNSIRERVRAAVSLAAVSSAMCAWMLYLQVNFHDALLWVHAEETWRRVFVFPWQTFQWTIQDILSGQGAVANNISDLGLTLIALGAILAGFKKLPPAFSAFSLIMLVVPLLSYAQAGGYSLAPMAAAGRRTLAVFPVFVALAAVWRGRWRTPLWTILSLALQTTLFVAFSQWLWVD